jgi:hypothetical protein
MPRRHRAGKRREIIGPQRNDLSDGALEVQNLVGDGTVVYVEERMARRLPAVRVANFGSVSEPLWVPLSVESITECGIDGEPPSANELVS